MRYIGTPEERGRHFRVLADRGAYLRVRIEAKKAVGWETQYDEAERAALEWALDQLIEAAWPEERPKESDGKAAPQGDDCP